MKKTQTESQLRSAFLLKPWKKSLHPKTHREHYNHKSDAIKASSSYLLRDALVPVRERESYKHPVLGENIFDFERKVILNGIHRNFFYHWQNGVTVGGGLMSRYSGFQRI